MGNVITCSGVIYIVTGNQKSKRLRVTTFILSHKLKEKHDNDISTGREKVTWHAEALTAKLFSSSLLCGDVITTDAESLRSYVYVLKYLYLLDLGFSTRKWEGCTHLRISEWGKTTNTLILL